MPGRSINVVVPHSLGIEVAKVRLRNTVDDYRSSDPNVVTHDFAWHDLQHTFTLELTAYGTPVKASIVIMANSVRATTEPIGGFYPLVVAAVWRAESLIKSKLAEALK